MKLYAIKPLKWEHTREFYPEYYTVATVFGRINVEEDPTGNGRWRFNWCFQEYYDEGVSSKNFRDAKTAKFAAEAFYQGKLRKALTSKQEN